MRVYSPTPLDAVDYHERPDGFADVRLRRNFETITRSCNDGVDSVEYCADELYFVTSLTLANVIADSDSLWSDIEREQMTPDERLAEIESNIVDTQIAVCDFYESVIGGE